jgi:hypothetical protein
MLFFGIFHSKPSSYWGTSISPGSAASLAPEDIGMAGDVTNNHGEFYGVNMFGEWNIPCYGKTNHHFIIYYLTGI